MPSTNLFPWQKYRLLRKGSSDSQWQDDISLTQLGTAPSVRDQVDKDGGKQRLQNHWRFLCYFLHAFLVFLHLILLGTAVSHHPERRVIIQHDIDTFTIGLSGGLQAFYTLYTAVLVFVTQRLMLSAIFSRPKKLTQIHDICGAWAGLGAALNAIWQQTKVASSTLSIAIVTVYFVCISVLHVTSSTLMQIQLLNDTTPVMVPMVETWPDGSVNLASLDWVAVTALVPFLQSLYGNTTNGLANNTLYDVPMPNSVNATVQATTVNSQCGLLTNLSVEASSDNTQWNINTSLTDLGTVSITFPYPPLLNEIWFSPTVQCSQTSDICSNFILYLVSAEIEVNDSVEGVSHVYVNGTYSPPGGTPQNFSSPIYFIACSLNTTNHTAALDPSGIQLGSDRQQTSLAWSAFSPSGDVNLTSAISYAMTSANSLPPSPYCQPLMSYAPLWANITGFNAYMRSHLGMNISSCGGNLAQYTTTPSLLTVDQFESTVSQFTAEFIWLAGELGSAGGGFDRQTKESLVLPFMQQQWKLNINPLPVILALCASVILFVLVVCVLRRHNQVAVPGAGVLEIMWFGSRSQILRGHLSRVQIPSPDSLRASSMFETVFWTHPGDEHKENSTVYAAATFYDGGTHASSSRSPSISESEPENLRSGVVSQYRPSSKSSNGSSSRRWCYVLHTVFVALHIVLLALLVHHPEQSVVILYESSALTVGLSAILQGVYTLYSAVLVFLMQRLALLKMVSEQRKLTAIHDVSGAWTGIGAAIYVLWQQHKTSSSTREIITVWAYLTLMLVLHIASSSIMQWQSFSGELIGTIPMNLALPAGATNLNQLSWTEVFPVVRSLNQDTGVSTYGLSNTTLYDVPQNSDNGIFTSASTNATTLIAQCGLVSNLTFSQLNDSAYQISFQNGSNQGSFVDSLLLPGFVHGISPTTVAASANQSEYVCAVCPQTLFYMITTNVNMDESTHDSGAVVSFNWSYMTGYPPTTVAFYIAACSLDAQTLSASLSLQTDALEINPNQATLSAGSSSWSVWSPGNATNLNIGIVTAFRDINSSASIDYPEELNYSFDPTAMDSYIMSLLGLSMEQLNSSVTLSPWQLENAIAQTAAKFLWLAGLLGEDGGGFQRPAGENQAMGDTVQWRLHLNTVPVVLASIASFLSLILAMVIIGRGPARRQVTSVSGTSVLECLWIEAQSESLHSRLATIEEPHLDKLRAAGMFDICLGDIGQRSSYPEAEEPILRPGSE